MQSFIKASGAVCYNVKGITYPIKIRVDWPKMIKKYLGPHQHWDWGWYYSETERCYLTNRPKVIYLYNYQYNKEFEDFLYDLGLLII